MISLPPGTEMFHFPGLAPRACARVTGLAPRRVSPFGHPEITARVQLPQAFRSLPRPSSPLDAKASTVCLIAFDLDLYRYGRSSGPSVPRFGFPNNNTIRPSVVKEQNQCEPWDRQCGRHLEDFRARTRGSGVTRRSRKEVIQPQVPLRLPCYDFAPVTELTFGGCPLAVGPPTSGPPSFHGVTGGVYKARERIHRGVADPRLLAIPASCGRVAAHNPNLDRLFAISAPLRVGDALYRPL